MYLNQYKLFENTVSIKGRCYQLDVHCEIALALLASDDIGVKFDIDLKEMVSKRIKNSLECLRKIQIRRLDFGPLSKK